MQLFQIALPYLRTIKQLTYNLGCANWACGMSYETLLVFFITWCQQYRFVSDVVMKSIIRMGIHICIKFHASQAVASPTADDTYNCIFTQICTLCHLKARGAIFIAYIRHICCIYIDIDVWTLFMQNRYATDVELLSGMELMFIELGFRNTRPWYLSAIA